MVMKLQLLISKLNVSLEEQSELIDSTMPRVLRETESIQSEADVLSSKMTFIRSEVEQVNQETGSSMRQLVQMDLFKSKSMCIVETFSKDCLYGWCTEGDFAQGCLSSRGLGQEPKQRNWTSPKFKFWKAHPELPHIIVDRSY